MLSILSLENSKQDFFLGFVSGVFLFGFFVWGFFLGGGRIFCSMLSVRCFQLVSLREAVHGEALVLDRGSWYFNCIVTGMVGGQVGD